MIEIKITIEEQIVAGSAHELAVRVKGINIPPGATKIETECAQAITAGISKSNNEFHKALSKKEGVAWITPGEERMVSYVRKLPET